VSCYHLKRGFKKKFLSWPIIQLDPYCSWQRGLNENTNGLLRQYWPKSTDFKLISDEDVRVNLVQLNKNNSHNQAL
jgi:IS30 family transposase